MATGEVVVRLPPIPTLISALNIQGAAQAELPGAATVAAPTPIIPQFIQPVKIISRDGSGRPDTGVSNRGGGGGTTRSSR